MRRIVTLSMIAALSAGAASHAAEAPRAPRAPMAPVAGATAAATTEALPLYINVFGAAGEAVKKPGPAAPAAKPMTPAQVAEDELLAVLNNAVLTPGGTRDVSTQPPMVIQEMAGYGQRTCQKAGGVFKVEKTGVFSCS